MQDSLANYQYGVVLVEFPLLHVERKAHASACMYVGRIK